MITDLRDSELGRIAKECYKLTSKDLLECHPGHEKWKSSSSRREHSTMIVGRGVFVDADAATESKKVICLDVFGGAFKESNADHLWMDFNMPRAVQQLPVHFLQEIIFDYSTWRYMKISIMKDQWLDLLLPGGRLIFEAGISSFKIVTLLDDKTLEREGYDHVEGSDWTFEHSNPTHPVFTKEQIERHLGSNLCSKILGAKTIRFNERIIIPAYTLSNEQGSENSLTISKTQIGAILKERTMDALSNAYQSLFSPLATAHFKKQDNLFPIHTSKPVSSWIQVSKCG